MGGAEANVHNVGGTCGVHEQTFRFGPLPLVYSSGQVGEVDEADHGYHAVEVVNRYEAIRQIRKQRVAD